MTDSQPARVVQAGDQCAAAGGVRAGHRLTGAAWLDPVAGFVIAAFAVHEGKEAWEGELAEDDDDD